MYLEKVFVFQEENSILGEMYEDIDSKFKEKASQEAFQKFYDYLKVVSAKSNEDFEEGFSLFNDCIVSCSEFFMEQAYCAGVGDGISLVFKSISSQY